MDSTKLQRGRLQALRERVGPELEHFRPFLTSVLALPATAAARFPAASCRAGGQAGRQAGSQAGRRAGGQALLDTCVWHFRLCSVVGVPLASKH
eukprot:14381038-Alexandrium_andersonii.AAC.1